jgi:polysaccharide pyruvyl transferase WcaK-like protein
MKNQSQPKKIGIFGHVGTQNLGDETIIAAVIQNIRIRYPDAEIRAFTFNPLDTTQRHGITAFPIRRINGAPRPECKSMEEGSASSPGNGSSSGRQSIKAGIKKIPVVYPALKAVQKGLHAIWHSVTRT